MIAFRDEVEFSFFHLGRNPPLPFPPLLLTIETEKTPSGLMLHHLVSL